MKRLIITILSLIILLSACGSGYTAAYEISYNNVSYTYQDMDTLIELIAEQVSDMDAAHQMAEAARQLGYSEQHEVITLAQKEWSEARKNKTELETVQKTLSDRWQQKVDEYPVATYIWSYFQKLGYSNQVCAGILGNIMTEVGGNTLDIQPERSNSTYYGICQWNKAYSKVWGTSLEQQCNFLYNTIEYELNTFGFCYRGGFNYKQFLELTDPQDVALAFSKCYERNSPASYLSRRDNAITAYNYFVS